jgi:energy-converting hydrogenase Eha subunit C
VQFAGTQQLAALGPTSVIFNFSSYVFNALGIATTTVVSHHVAKQDLSQANDSATTALLFGLVSGAVMLALLQVGTFCCVACTRHLHLPSTAVCGCVACIALPLAPSQLRLTIFSMTRSSSAPA